MSARPDDMGDDASKADMATGRLCDPGDVALELVDAMGEQTCLARTVESKGRCARHALTHDLEVNAAIAHVERLAPPAAARDHGCLGGCHRSADVLFNSVRHANV